MNQRKTIDLPFSPEDVRLGRAGFVVLLIELESAIEKARNRFKHIALDTSPKGYGGGHERVCFNATNGMSELHALLARIERVRMECQKP